MNLAGFGHPKVWKKKMHRFHSPSLTVHNTELSLPLRFSEIEKMRDRITKQFAFYRCIIVNTCDLNAGR